MKPPKTQEETLAELAARSSEGAGSAKRFTALVKRIVNASPQPTNKTPEKITK